MNFSKAHERNVFDKGRVSFNQRYFSDVYLKLNYSLDKDNLCLERPQYCIMLRGVILNYLQKYPDMSICKKGESLLSLASLSAN